MKPKTRSRHYEEAIPERPFSCKNTAQMTCEDERPECWELLVENSEATANDKKEKPQDIYVVTPVSSSASASSSLSYDRWESLQEASCLTTNEISLERKGTNASFSGSQYHGEIISSSSFSGDLHESKPREKPKANLQTDLFSKKTDSCDKKPFAPGDHIYMHCRAGIMEYQHHGIVLEVRKSSDEGNILKIADFTNNENTIALPASVNIYSLSESSQRNGAQELKSVQINGLRVSEFSSEEWHVVHYGADDQSCKVAPPGTCTTAFCDCRRLVLARVDFLVKNPDLLPKYELLEANCECVAVWCKTGVWATTQVASVLLDAAVKKAGVAIAATGIAAALPVTVPAEGLLGLAGLTTQVSLLTVAPWIPLVGALAVGATALLLQSSNNKWRDRTEFLNKKYRQYTAAVIIQRCWRARKKSPHCVIS